jgi:hypothetical protein
MTAGDILDYGVKIYLGRFATFSLINLIIQSPLIAYRFLRPTIDFDDDDAWEIAGRIAAEVAAELALFFVVSAASICLIEQAFVGKKLGVAGALGALLRRAVLLAAAIFFLICLLAAGCVFGIIPGFILMYMYAYVGHAVVVENAGPINAFARSGQLASGYWGRNLAITSITILINLGLWLLAASALEDVLPVEEVIQNARGANVHEFSLSNRMIHAAAHSLIAVMIDSYGAICLALAYFDIRARNEGLDLELTARGKAEFDDGGDERWRNRNSGYRDRDEIDHEEEWRRRQRRRRAKSYDYDGSRRRRDYHNPFLDQYDQSD